MFLGLGFLWSEYLLILVDCLCMWHQFFADAEVLEKLPPDSTEQQAQITAIQNDDGYNWG